MANDKTKKTSTRGGKKVTTKKVTPSTYSRKTVVKSPRKTALKSYSSSYKNGVGKLNDKTYKSASSLGGTRKSSSSSTKTTIDKKNRYSVSGVNTKTTKVKNPRKTKTKSGTYGYSRGSNYDKDGLTISSTDSNLEKNKTYKSTARGRVKATERVSRYGESSTPDKNIGTTKSYKYTKKPSGSTKLKQRSSTFSGKGYTAKVDKYKGGKLVNSKTKTKTYKKK